MTPAEYRDWFRASGVYRGNVLPAERYAVLSGLLSDAGVTVLLVQRLLDENEEVIDLARWWAGGVYTPFQAADGKQDLEATAAALAAVGAVRAAERVRAMTAKSSSYLHEENLNTDEAVEAGELTRREREKVETVAQLMPRWREFMARRTPTAGIERREEIASLLDAFAARHSGDLKADVRHHGDPRKDKGYDAERADEERRRREYITFIRDELRDKEQDYRRRLSEAAAFLEGDALAKPQKLDRIRRFIGERVDEWEAYDDDVPDERMRRLLGEFRALMERHPAAFPTVPTADEAINARMMAIGPYRLVRESDRDIVSWLQPAGLSCDWTAVRLDFTVEATGVLDESYSELLNRYEALCRETGRVFAELREEILDTFRTVYEEQLHPDELEEYERDVDGAVADAAILSRVRYASIGLSNGEPPAMIWCRVEWDPEHGFETFLDEEWRVSRGW